MQSTCITKLGGGVDEVGGGDGDDVWVDGGDGMEGGEGGEGVVWLEVEVGDSGQSQSSSDTIVP